MVIWIKTILQQFKSRIYVAHNCKWPINSLQTNNSINFRVKKKKRLLVEYRFENEDDEMA